MLCTDTDSYFWIAPENKNTSEVYTLTSNCALQEHCYGYSVYITVAFFHFSVLMIFFFCSTKRCQAGICMRKEDQREIEIGAVFGYICYCSGMSRHVGMHRAWIMSSWDSAKMEEQGRRRHYPRHNQKCDLHFTVLLISTNKCDFFQR